MGRPHFFWVIFWEAPFFVFVTPVLAYMWGQRHLLAQQGSVFCRLIVCVFV